uniref:G_PROTEIN_RECEP_F1_2 domain-containing protein n=1 Tax=Ascaris lumbricoides TaxID=6252 RepID=A0A0M3HUV0_ASCLU
MGILAEEWSGGVNAGITCRDSFPGSSAMCKLTAFATNSTACFVNWVWVIMFVQRLTFVVFPMERVKPSGTFFQLICNTKRALAITAFMATTTQAWSPILMTEITIRDNEGEVEASFCGADSTLVYEQLFKWIAVAESMWTYAIPFFVTVVSDMAVIVLHHSSTKFTLVSREDMRNFPLYVTSSSGTQRNNCASSDCVALKIQSTESIKTCTVRRQRAIRRCLLMATIQLLLNLPNYVLQLVDEFACLRNSETSSVFYVYADAVFYILYLLQFPMLAIYVHLLHQDVHLIRGNELPNRKLLLHTIDRQLNGSRRRSRGASGSGRLTCIRSIANQRECYRIELCICFTLIQWSV